MDSFKRLVVGVENDPQVVGAARAFILYALPLAVGSLGLYLSGTHDPHWAWLVALFPLIRAVEGVAIDQLQKPYSNQVDPPPVAGERTPPAVPAK